MPDQDDPLGILTAPPKTHVSQEADPLGILKKKDGGNDSGIGVEKSFENIKPPERVFGIGLSRKSRKVHELAPNEIAVPNQGELTPMQISNQSELADAGDTYEQYKRKERIELHKKKVEAATPAAVTSAAKKSLKAQGINPNNTALLNNEKQKFEQQLSKGEAEVGFNADGSAGLIAKYGGLKLAHKNMMGAINATKESREFKNMNLDERIAYADKKEKEAASTPYIGETGKNSFANTLGMFGGAAPTLGLYGAAGATGSLIEATGGATAVPLAPVMTFAFNAGNGANERGMQGTMQRYYDNLNKGMDKKSAMAHATTGEDIDRMTGIVETAAFSAMAGEGLKAGKTVTSGLLKTLGKEALKGGAVIAGAEGLSDLGHNLEGDSNKSGGEILKDMAHTLEENAPMLTILPLAFAAAGKAFELPKIIKNSIKYDAAKLPPEQLKAAVDLNVQQGNVSPELANKTLSDIQQVRDVANKLPSGLSDESKSSASGLIIKRDNLKKELETLDESAKELHNQEIESINNRLKEIYRTGKPEEHEINEQTGETYKQPTFDDVQKSRVEDLAANIAKGKRIEDPEHLQAEQQFPDELKKELEKIKKSETPKEDEPQSDAYKNVNRYIKKNEQATETETQKEASSPQSESPENKTNEISTEETSVEPSVSINKNEDFTAKGGNKVVDEKGEPLVVYHGTNKDVEALDVSKPQRGLFFTKDKNAASSYANANDKNGRVIEANINLKNPHIIDAKGKSFDNIEVDLDKADPATGEGVSKKMTTDEIVEALRGMRSEKIITNLYGSETKADGIIIKNVKDNLSKQSEPTDIYIPFKNEQVSENKEAVSIGEQNNVKPENKGEKEPPLPPIEDVVEGNVHKEYPPTSLSYSGTGKIETEFGTDERLPTKTKHDIETIKQADNLLEDGWNVKDALNKIENEGHTPSDAEYINMTRYAAELSDRLRNMDINSPEYDKTLSELNRVANVSNIAGKEQGRALGIRGRFKTVADGTYGDFMLTELNANNDAPLTDKQKETAQKDFSQLGEAKAKFEADRKAFEDKVAAFKAEQELAKQKKTASTGKRKNHEDLVKERQEIFTSISDKLRKARGETNLIAVPYAKELIAIAPDVLKLARNLVEDGVIKLEEVIKAIHPQLKDEIPDLKERDIHDILAGEYTKKKQTKSEVAKRMEDLRIEAKLINRLENLEKSVPKSEKQKIKRNQEIEKVRGQIKDYKKEETIAQKFFGESDAAEKKLDKLKDELERVKQRKAKEPRGTKGATEISEREQEIRNDIKKAQAEWDNAKQKAKQAMDDYRRMETERNRQLQKVSDLTEKLGRLQQGIRDVSDKKDVKVDTPEIENLKKQVLEESKKLSQIEAAERKVISADEAEANKFYGEEKNTERAALASLKKKNIKEIDRLKEKLRTFDYEPDQKKIPLLQDRELQKKFPNAFKDAVKSRDDLIKVKQKIELRRAQQLYEQRTPQQKFQNLAVRVLNVPRTLMASMDLSAPLRQGIVAAASHPILAAKAFRFMLKAAASEKVYNRWLDEVHNSPLWNDANKSGLAITDPETLHLKEKEEAFLGSSLAEKIPIIGTIGVKGSERAYIGFLNKMRWDLFTQYAQAFQDKGKTYDNNPELYKGLSSFINASTGRGGMAFGEAASPILSSVLFSPRLIASRMNMLGLTDIPNLAVRIGTLGKRGVPYGFYSSLPKEIRTKAAIDMAKFIAVGLSTLALAKSLSNATGGDVSVEADPRSSDFGKIKSGNTRWDIWGGFQPYARLLTQVLTGQSKSTGSGKVYELDGKKFGSRTVGDQLATFGRGKLAPVWGTIGDVLTRRTLDQQTVDRRFDIPFYPEDNPDAGHISLTDELFRDVTPLLINDTKDAMKDRGVSALFSVGIPSALGVGVQTYSSTKGGSGGGGGASGGREPKLKEKKEKSEPRER